MAPRHALHYDPISVLKERRWNHINIRALQRLLKKKGRARNHPDRKPVRAGLPVIFTKGDFLPPEVNGDLHGCVIGMLWRP